MLFINDVYKPHYISILQIMMFVDGMVQVVIQIMSKEGTILPHPDGVGIQKPIKKDDII